MQHPTAAGVPVLEGLFEVVDGVTRLLTSQCPRCASQYFPRRVWCANPACGTAATQPTQVSGSGTLYSYTVQRYQPPPIFALADWAPYALGLVDLGQGLRVLGMVRGVAPEELVIGQTVVLDVEALGSDASGGTPTTFVFRVAGEAGR